MCPTKEKDRMKNEIFNMTQHKGNKTNRSVT